MGARRFHASIREVIIFALGLNNAHLVKFAIGIDASEWLFSSFFKCFGGQFPRLAREIHVSYIRARIVPKDILVNIEQITLIFGHCGPARACIWRDPVWLAWSSVPIKERHPFTICVLFSVTVDIQENRSAIILNCYFCFCFIHVRTISEPEPTSKLFLQKKSPLDCQRVPGHYLITWLRSRSMS